MMCPSVPFTLRNQTMTADDDAIAAVHRAAFPGNDEARLVAALVSDGDMRVSLVAEAAGGIIGHVMFSAMAVLADGVPVAAAGLAPVAVVPNRQRDGIGSALIRAGLEALAAQAVSIVFVLGDPRYYRRFGFDAGIAAGFANPYAGPYLMARWLSDARLIGQGSAAYSPAFARMGATA